MSKTRVAAAGLIIAVAAAAVVVVSSQPKSNVFEEFGPDCRLGGTVPYMAPDEYAYRLYPYENVLGDWVDNLANVWVDSCDQLVLDTTGDALALYDTIVTGAGQYGPVRVRRVRYTYDQLSAIRDLVLHRYGGGDAHDPVTEVLFDTYTDALVVGVLGTEAEWQFPAHEFPYHSIGRVDYAHSYFSNLEDPLDDPPASGK